MPKKEIIWDLSELFPSTRDPSVQEAIENVTIMAENFSRNYQGRIKNLSAKELAKCIEEYEEYSAKLDDVTLFARLSFDANMTLPDTQHLHDKADKLEAELNKKLAFFKIKLGNLVYKNPEIIIEPILSNYKHFLERLKRGVPHQLSEVEERLIIEKDQYGVKAWQDLQSKWLNTRMFEVEVEGKKKVLSFGEAIGLTRHHDRATRESAMKSIFGLLGKDGEIFSSALRNICNDWSNVCERRKYASPMEASLIENDTDLLTINDLLNTIENHNGLYQRYLKLKAKIMGLPKLGPHDIGAPIPDAREMKFDYDMAKNLILEAFRRFDEDYDFAMRDLFAKNHVDASPRFGKRNGAWCPDWYNGKSAFILTNFNETLSDVYTLAHELGHATHLYHSQRDQTFLNGSWAIFPMIIAEVASIFGELLLTDLLLNQAESDIEKKVILCRVLDGAGVTIFQVTERAWFEKSLYEAVKEGEFLDFPTICRYEKSARDKLFGDAVEWFDEIEAIWTMIPHYYMANYRFYNYPYAYAQLFVYALYQKYLEEGKEFVPRFREILSSGCSISPIEIGKIVGLDVTSSDFWKLGMRQYGYFVGELEKVVG